MVNGEVSRRSRSSLIVGNAFHWWALTSDVFLVNSLPLLSQLTDTLSRRLERTGFSRKTYPVRVVRRYRTSRSLCNSKINMEVSNHQKKTSLRMQR